MPLRIFPSLLLLSVTHLFAAAGEFTTALGGTYPVLVSAITADSAGNTYVVGNSQSHVLVAKLDPGGNVLFNRSLAGQGIDTGTAIAIDSSGNIYIAGNTTSADFPLSHALQTQIFPVASVNGVAAGSGFITKLSNDGATILYSTFFGGTLGQSAISSLAIDAKGNLYLTGYTQASDFPHTAGMPFGAVTQSPASPGAIIASISAAGDKILYSGAIPMPTACPVDDPSCISHTLQWEGVGIALDAAGNAYVAGNDPSATNLPATAGVLSPKGIGAFVAKVNAGGAGLGYLTYVSSGAGPYFSPATTLSAIAVNAAGNAYLGGQTIDANLPTTAGSFQPTYLPNAFHGFLAKLNPNGTAMVWASYFAVPQAIAIDAGGNVWATGTASSPTFPNADGWSTGPEFLTEVSAPGSQLTYSALYPSGTVAQSLALDPSGMLHVAGLNGFISTIAPTTAAAPRISYLASAGGGNATARISPAEVIAIYGPGIGPAAPAIAAPANGFYPTTLAGIEVSIDGVKIPLLYAGANQINAVVPMNLSIDIAATLRVTNSTTAGPAFPVWIVAATPLALGPVTNRDGTLNSQTKPAKSGSVVTFYATGWQSNFSPLADGQIATAAEDACLGRCTGGAMTIPLPFTNQTTLPVTVLYGGAAPSIVAGVTQFNVQLGNFSTTGTDPIYFSLGLNGPSSATGPGPAVETGLWIIP